MTPEDALESACKSSHEMLVDRACDMDNADRYEEFEDLMSKSWEYLTPDIRQTWRDIITEAIAVYDDQREVD